MSDVKQAAVSSQLRSNSLARPVKHVANAEGAITVVKSADELSFYFGALEELATAATDSNPLFEASALLAAMRHLAPAGAVHVAFVWDEIDGGRVLIGAFPFQARRFYLGLPVVVWSLWIHIHSFIATPLLRSGHERKALGEFLSLASRSGAPLIRLPLFEADGAFNAALTEVIADNTLPYVETSRHERAFLKSDLDGEAYLSAHMRKKKRKEYNRLWNRLAELGELEFSTHHGGHDLTNWLDEFLRLEAAGWKGKRGTALAERAEERAFFEELASAWHVKGRLHCAEIRLDRRPIAMLATFLSGGGGYSFKIAYDESLAKYSPGALLMMKVIGAFQSDPDVAWVDSCAIPNHPMIDHIWAERRSIREVNVATSARGGLIVAYTARASRLADYVWARARAVYYRIRKEVEHEQAH